MAIRSAASPVTPDLHTAPLTIHLLGRPPARLLVRGVAARLPSRPLHLLGLLVCRHVDAPLERSWLAATLWPDSLHDAARTSLRQAVTELRRALGPEAARLHAPARGMLALKLTGCEVDLVAFDRASHRPGRAARPRELLPELACEWVAQERVVRG